MTPLRATLDAAFAAAPGGSSLLATSTRCRALCDAVNTERAKRGKPSVTVLEVLRVERSAEGHVDYRVKFVLGCAELVERP